MSEQSEASQLVEEREEYKWGFVTDIESDVIAPGLNEDVVRLISHKKNEPEFMLEWRLDHAGQHVISTNFLCTD